MKEIAIVDAFCVMSGEDGAFFAYMDADEAVRIANNGWEESQPIMLRHGEERPLPTKLLDGLACLEDVFIKLEPNVEVSLS